MEDRLARTGRSTRRQPELAAGLDDGHRRRLAHVPGNRLVVAGVGQGDPHKSRTRVE